MEKLTTPIPTNFNPLQSNGFMFSISKISDISFFCQEANIPGITLASPEMATPLSKIPLAGDTIDFDDLVITFLIDENMTNYLLIHDWLIGLGFPDDHKQYTKFIAPNSLHRNELSQAMSDGVLQILGSSNNVVRTVHFKDLVPVNLQSLRLESTTSETVYLAGYATFKFQSFYFE